MKNSLITEQEIKNAICNIDNFKNREEIQILIKKEIGNWYLYIQRLIDWLWFSRFDIMRAGKDREWSENEPEWILVFLDEWEKLFPLDKDYSNKREEYKNWIINHKNRSLNLDHRLVTKDSYLRWYQLFNIALDFFTIYNKTIWKTFYSLHINRVWQIQTIQRLLKLWFKFINASDILLFQSIIDNPKNRDSIDYKTTYWDTITNMIIKKWDSIKRENLVIFQMKLNI